MLKWVKHFFSNMFGKNTEIYQKPLNTLSVIFVIAFDIFLFYNILSGYNYQKDFVVSPYEKYSCINYFYDQKNDLLNSIYYYYPNDTFLKVDSDGNTKTVNYNGDICNTLYGKISDIQTSQEYIDFKNTSDKYQSEISVLESKKYDYESQYRDFLEESKAGIYDDNSRLSDIDKENARLNYNNIKNNILNLSQEKKDLENTFLQSNPLLWDIHNFITDNKENFLKNYDKEIFWYPVKIAFFQAILLLPLFLISLFFYSFFLKRHNKIFTILFSNLTFITGIFVFILFLKVIYFIIPKKLFASFIALLKQLSLWFLWNYILVVIWVFIFWFIIYLSQKSIEKYELIKKEQLALQMKQNKTKVQKDRFEKKLCGECWVKLLPDSIYCQECWAHQYDECVHCHNLIPKVFGYCNKCWEKK